VDRRAKKLEKKRKSREQAKKKASVLMAQKPDALTQLVRSSARSELGPCYVSAGWDDLGTPELVTVIVTRALPSGQVLVGTVLVDRTCLGIKNAFAMDPMQHGDVAAVVERVGAASTMLSCEPLVAQSIVYHALDYARSLGFEPHRDFREPLFGPRPAVLLDTPWSTSERPIYVPGPSDNEAVIESRLTKAVGAYGYDIFDPRPWLDEAALQDGDDWFDDDDDMPNVHSPLEQTLTRDGTTVSIWIYRGEREPDWLLEIEDQGGGSTVFHKRYATDRAALDAALQAIEEDGIASFVVEKVAPPTP
jgi:hypothetical protein